MESETLLLEVKPAGLEIIDRLRKTRDEAPDAVIARALALMGALQKYVKDDALVVRDPYGPVEDDLVELTLFPERREQRA